MASHWFSQSSPWKVQTILRGPVGQPGRRAPRRSFAWFPGVALKTFALLAGGLLVSILGNLSIHAETFCQVDVLKL